METLCKNQEISLLKKLVNGDGYFAEKFGEDIDVMCKNIKNDFPIEMNTSFGDLEQEIEENKCKIKDILEKLEKRDKMIDNLKRKIEYSTNWRSKILKILISSEKEGTEINLNHLFSSREIVLEKLEQGIALTSDELEFVKETI